MLEGNTQANKLRARVSFQTTRLFDITGENLAERAQMIAEWFRDRLSG